MRCNYLTARHQLLSIFCYGHSCNINKKLNNLFFVMDLSEMHLYHLTITYDGKRELILVQSEHWTQFIGVFFSR